MSDYKRSKVVRYPITTEQYELILKTFKVEDRWDLEGYPELFDYSAINKFWIEEDYYQGTGLYLDYRLDRKYGVEGDFHRLRYLTENEQKKYETIFKTILEEVDPSKFKYVDFSWYNGVDKPIYYNEELDSFYNEI